MKRKTKPLLIAASLLAFAFYSIASAATVEKISIAGKFPTNQLPANPGCGLASSLAS
jgi:hypothetical protein